MELYNSVISNSDIKTNYDPNKNITRPVLSKYELAKVIGMRMEQIARGGKSTIDTTGLTTVREIAFNELKEKKLPFMISRSLPNGKKEIWKLEDMIY
jgi:DNA-directed RNA polymerase subunit K/omega